MLTESQRQYRSVMVIENFVHRLNIASNSTGVPVRDIVRMMRAGVKVLHADANGHDYRPFDTSIQRVGGTVTVKLPDIRMWDKARENLGL